MICWLSNTWTGLIAWVHELVVSFYRWPLKEQQRRANLCCLATGESLGQLFADKKKGNNYVLIKYKLEEIK